MANEPEKSEKKIQGASTFEEILKEILLALLFQECFERFGAFAFRRVASEDTADTDSEDGGSIVVRLLSTSTDAASPEPMTSRGRQVKSEVQVRNVTCRDLLSRQKVMGIIHLS